MDQGFGIPDAQHYICVDDKRGGGGYFRGNVGDIFVENEIRPNKKEMSNFT